MGRPSAHDAGQLSRSRRLWPGHAEERRCREVARADIALAAEAARRAEADSGRDLLRHVDSKHSIGVYSAASPKGPWRREEPTETQRAVDAEAHPEVVPSPAGPSTIETYTVLHGRDGAPERGIVIGRLGDGSRFIANTPADRVLREHMEAYEMIGAHGTVEPAGDDTNLWRPS